ncbi:MAG: DNA-binding transcriptional regulator, LysR family [Frankiales bacterium]|nr:DNA-binding transcriptional regulator, LysR family [Frankiales bacterium]
MELRHLEHFLAVADEGSFTRAANQLHLVQSAQSVSLRSQEKELGVRLFDRNTHRVELTDTGQALVPEARRTLAAADAARDAVAAAQGGLRGTVRIGIMHSLSLIDLAGLLTEFHRDRPQVQLIPQAAQGGSAELAREVAEGRLDLAFVGLPDPYPSGLTVRPLASEPMMLACPPEDPLAQRRLIDLSELEAKPFVDFPSGWGTRVAVDRLFLAHGLQREITVEVADIPNILNLVNAGFGFAFLSPSLIGGKQGQLRRVRPNPEFVVSMITSERRPLSAAARALVGLVNHRYPSLRPDRSPRPRARPPS